MSVETGRLSASAVETMFDRIAPVYDAMNRVMTAGLDQRWRAETVRETVRPGDRVLDCATGTGDLALAFKRTVGPSGEVVGTDFCAEMLARAPAKARRAGLDVRFEVADALALPFADASFDVASIGFGIRNVDDPVRCLREMARVVRPRGRVVVEAGASDGSSPCWVGSSMPSSASTSSAALPSEVDTWAAPPSAGTPCASIPCASSAGTARYLFSPSSAGTSHSCGPRTRRK